MYQKACCTCRVVVLPTQPIAFLTFSLSSPSKVPSKTEKRERRTSTGKVKMKNGNKTLLSALSVTSSLFFFILFPFFIHPFPLFVPCSPFPVLIGTLGSFSNDDGDGKEDIKKGLLRKTTTLHVHHAFLYISLPSLHDYDVKMPNYKFYIIMEDVNKRRRISFSLSKLECGPQETNSREIRPHLPFSAKWNKRDKD